MSVLTERLRRLREMSLPEIRFRAAQKLRIARELAAVRQLPANGSGTPQLHWHQFWDPERVTDAALRAEILAGYSDAAAARLPEYFAARTTPSFFFTPVERGAIVASHRRTFPAREEEIRCEADALCAHRLKIFAYPEVECGATIPWRRDLIHGQESSLDHWSRIPYLDFQACGDSKIVWEPSRHQHFITLGQAYLFTGDERYAEECLAQLEHWQRESPYLRGIHWASSLEVAFRSWSWLWALHLLLGSRALSGARLADLTRGLARHAEFIAANLSTYFSPNTHLLGEGFSLFAVGLLFPELRHSQAWRDTGRKILEEEISRQVRPDGSHAEQSSYYHHYASDFFLCAAILAARNSCPFPAACLDRLAHMLEFLMHSAWPSGRHPMTGDADGGRLLALASRTPDDFRALLSTGAVLFRRGDFRRQASRFHAETLWLCGSQSAEQFAALQPVAPRDSSRVFPAAGLVAMRSGWPDSPGQSRLLLFDAGPQGAGTCGHGHADALSILCSADGTDWLVDPGTFVYTSSRAWRDFFRSTRAHNTAVVDSRDQADPVDFFKWRAIPETRLEHWLSTLALDLAIASHSGYSRLPNPVVHRRTILFVKPDYWIVSDEFSAPSSLQPGPAGRAAHLLEFFFHFAPDMTTVQSKGYCLASQADSRFLLVTPHEGVEFRVALAEESPLQGWYSDDYGRRAPAPVLVGRAESLLPAKFHWILWPSPCGPEASWPRLRVLPGPGLRLAVDSAAGTDLLAVRGQETAPSGSSLFTDAELAFVRLEKSGAMERLALVNGCCAELDGRRLVAAESMLDELDARILGSRLEVTARPARRFALLAPGVSEVVCNGRPVSVRRGRRRGDWLEVQGEV